MISLSHKNNSELQFMTYEDSLIKEGGRRGMGGAVIERLTRPKIYNNKIIIPPRTPLSRTPMMKNN